MLDKVIRCMETICEVTGNAGGISHQKREYMHMPV